MPKGWKVVRVGSSSGDGSGRADAQSGWVSWVVNELDEGSRVGIDPKLISLGTFFFFPRWILINAHFLVT